MMYALLDHEDITKSRKALIACSLALIILHSFDVAGQKIDIFGLKISFDKNTSLALCGLFVLYFLYVFIIRLGEKEIANYLEKKLTAFKRKLDEIESELDGIEIPAAKKNDPEFLDNFSYYKLGIRRLKAEADKTILIFKQLGFILVDAGPPILFGVFALKKAKVFALIIAFIDLSQTSSP